MRPCCTPSPPRAPRRTARCRVTPRPPRFRPDSSKRRSFPTSTRRSGCRSLRTAGCSCASCAPAGCAWSSMGTWRRRTPWAPSTASRATSRNGGFKASPRRRGRPLKMTRSEILERIRPLAGQKDGLFRVHRTHGSLYACTRRHFGSWSAAVAAAGLDYREWRTRARRRSVRTRRRRQMAARPHRASPSGR